MKEAKAELRKIIAFSEKEHEVFVENKKVEIVHFHLQNNAFYKDLVGTTTFTNWENLPVLNNGYKEGDIIVHEDVDADVEINSGTLKFSISPVSLKDEDPVAHEVVAADIEVEFDIDE